MEKFIPYEKLSKKKKREIDLKKRKTWNINPTTRKPDNPRAYNRNKTRQRYKNSDEYFFAIMRKRTASTFVETVL